MEQQLQSYLDSNTNAVGPVTKTTTEIAAAVNKSPHAVYEVLLKMAGGGAAIDQGLVAPAAATPWDHNWSTWKDTTPP